MKKKFLLILFLSLMFFPALKVSANMICEYDMEDQYDSDNDVYVDVAGFSLIFDGDETTIVTKTTSGKRVEKIDMEYEGKCPSKLFVSPWYAAGYDFYYEADDIKESETFGFKFELIDSYSNKVSCGNVTAIPKKIPELTNMAVNLIQIAIPVILILMGSIDLFKGMVAQKEDEMKKGQQMFIKRLIVAAIIFFVIVIVKFLISIVADNTSSDNISKCIDCFLSGVENCK